MVETHSESGYIVAEAIEDAERNGEDSVDLRRSDRGTRVELTTAMSNGELLFSDFYLYW